MTCCGTPLDRQEQDAVSELLATKLAAFTRTLRDNAFAVGLSEASDAARLLTTDLVRRPATLRSAFRQLFCARKAEWDRFDGLFDAFWLGKRVRSRSLVSGGTQPQNSPSLKSLSDASANGSQEATDQVSAEGEDSQAAEGEGRMEGASRIDAINGVDFRKLSNPQDLALAHEVAENLARALRIRMTRRDLERRDGYRIHLRRTIHKAIGQGGVPMHLVMRRKRERPLKIVLLVDASGSMSLYTGVFLRFIHGILDAAPEAEAFLFHTRLAHVSDAMKERDAARALDRLSMMAQGAGGGTKIGECLADFNRQHAARVLGSRSCVLIFSDGYDTGEPSQLGEEMQALRRRCRRIAWLNPMMGWDGYEPVARGLQAALPHVDLHAPAHSLQSLADLEPYLARL